MEIKRIANELAKKYDTRDPFILADYLNILHKEHYLGNMSGYYLSYRGEKCIAVNSSIDNIYQKKIVMAHEVGHAVLHENNQCMFYSDTLFSRSRPEREANEFAAEFLIPDSIFFEYPDYTQEQISRLIGYGERLMWYKTIK